MTRTLALAALALAAITPARAHADIAVPEGGSGRGRVDDPTSEACLGSWSGPSPTDQELGEQRRRLGHDPEQANLLELRLAELEGKRGLWDSARRRLRGLVDSQVGGFPVDEALFDLALVELTQVQLHLNLAGVDLAGVDEVGQQRAQNARSLIKRLLTRFPDSKFVPDCFVLLGKYFHDQRRETEARPFFERVLLSSGKRCHAYAQYQLASMELDAGHYQAALLGHWKVVQQAPLAEAGLSDAAERGLIASYLKVGRPEEAARFFAGGKVDRAALLRRLADAYAAEGRMRERDLVGATGGHGK